jgi:hypothetical protein
MRPASGLARRLIAAHAIVIAVGATTLAVVAVLAGPGLFRIHVREALGPVSEAQRHISTRRSSVR